MNSNKRKLSPEFSLPVPKFARISYPNTTSKKTYISPFAKYAYIAQTNKSMQPVIPYQKKKSTSSSNITTFSQFIVSFQPVIPNRKKKFIESVQSDDLYQDTIDNGIKPFLEILSQKSYMMHVHKGWGHWEYYINPLTFEKIIGKFRPSEKFKNSITKSKEYSKLITFFENNEIFKKLKNICKTHPDYRGFGLDFLSKAKRLIDTRLSLICKLCFFMILLDFIEYHIKGVGAYSTTQGRHSYLCYANENYLHSAVSLLKKLF